MTVSSSTDFSLLMSLYNKENPVSLAAALESIVNQTLQPAEVVLVFDGPINEELEHVVNSFWEKLKSLRIIRLDQNVGLGKALNEGLIHCKFDLVARMDTDDICYPERFEKQIRYLRSNPEVSVLGTSVQEFDNNPNDLGIYRKLPTEYTDIIRFAKYRTPLNHPSVIFKRQVILDSGSYEDMPLFEDYYLWVRLLNKGYIIENIDEPLLHFRVGNDMIGRRHGFSYLVKELNFLKAVKKLGFINSKQFLISIVVKLPLRVIPKSALKFIYKSMLR